MYVSYLDPNTIDLYENLKQMYIYCDVIEPQMEGSNALKLLRVISMIAAAAEDDGREGKWEPKRIQYVKFRFPRDSNSHPFRITYALYKWQEHSDPSF